MYRRELELRGSYMCDRGAYKTLIRLAESGLLQLEQLDIKTFPLADVTDCIMYARKCSAMQFSIVEPSL